MAKIIAVTNQKGGVGKTTTAVNLAVGLAARGKKVLLVDSDPQGNATSGLGVDKSALTNTIYQVLIKTLKLPDTVLTTEHGVDLVPSTVDLAGAEVELTAAVARESRMKQALDMVRSDYDYILIDCPPSLGLLTLNALTACDEVLLPVQCEFYALEGLAQLLSTIELVRDNLNPAIEINGLVMTMFDSRTRLAAQVVDEVKEAFGDKLYSTLIPRNVRISEAPSFGLPVLTYDPASKGAEAYSDLVEEVLERAE